MMRARVLAIAAAAILLCGSSTRSASISDRVKASVVYLELAPPDAGEALGIGETGSGFIVASDRAGSYIMTAAHVLGCDSYGAGCAPAVEVRFASDPSKVWHGQRVYAGASLNEQDLAIVFVPRGSGRALRLGDAMPNQNVRALGFPQSAVLAAASNPGELAPVLRSGVILDLPGNAHRETLRMASHHGDSGGPIFDSGSGTVVGLVQGAAADTEEADRYGVGSAALKPIASMVTLALQHPVGHGGAGSDGRTRAWLLYLNAYHAITRFNYLAFGQFVSLLDTEDLSTLGDRLLDEALKAGSLDAAEFAVGSYENGARLVMHPEAFNIVKNAADKGDPIAAYVLSHHYYYIAQGDAKGTYGIDEDLTKDRARVLREKYLRAASNGGWPFATQELAYTEHDAAKTKILRDRADEGFLRLAATGDAAAADAYASDYMIFGLGQDWHNHATVVNNFRRAADLGSSSALQGLTIQLLGGLASSADRAEALRRNQAAADGGNKNAAEQLGQMYERGTGVPIDKEKALEAYALAYDGGVDQHTLQSKIEALTPNGAALTAGLKSSFGYASAAAASARLRFGRFRIVNGVVVYSDAKRSVIATAAFELHCDSFAQTCVAPDSVEIGSGAKRYAARLLHAADTSIEGGVALVEAQVGSMPAAHVQQSPGPIVVTAEYFGHSSRLDGDRWSTTTPYWGVLPHLSESGHVLDVVLPAEDAPGAGIFDYASGGLIGIYTDPYDLRHATGPAAISAALNAADIR